MKKVIIVFDSFFGNTERIARSIGGAIDTGNNVEILYVSEIKPEELAESAFLIVGSPTRKFRPTAAIKKWLDKIPEKALHGVGVAAFDTRIAVDDIDSRVGRFFVGHFGYAAKPIADKLVDRGGDLVVPPEGFYVEGTEGPLKKGEIDRAGQWARQIMEDE
jgi:flavodoxin